MEELNSIKYSDQILLFSNYNQNHIENTKLHAV